MKQKVNSNTKTKKIDKVMVDNKVYSRGFAEQEYLEGMMACDGSEAERYAFAYTMLKEGYNCIDTYKSVATTKVIRGKVADR